MPTPAERQALIFFAAIAALGVGVNAWRAARSEPVFPGSKRELAAQIARVDSAVASSPSREAKRRKKRDKGPPPVPPTPPPPPIIDLDVADAAAIEALPRVGPGMARRIVANRDSFGAFGSIEGLQRVRGIGPSLAGALTPLVRFTGVPRPGAPTASRKGWRRPAPP